MNTMKMKRILCGIMAVAGCLSLAACDAGDGAAEGPAQTTKAITAPAPSEKPADRAGRADPAAADKEETVYIQTDPSGAVREITVETVLNYGGDGNKIDDITNLTEIKNTEGDEEFTLGPKGSLIWEDHGEKICYEGVSSRELPVTIRLTYWLDGKEIAPADLAGQSGRVRIRFDYDNHTHETVTVSHADLSDDDDGAPEPPETEEVQTPIPFLAMSLAMLPEDVFQNVAVENGRLVTLGDSVVMLGYAFPGLSEALELTAVELTEDVEIPEYVELEADVTDFSLDFTATIVTNGFLEDLEPEKLDDIEKMTDGMDKLAEASENLTDGADELADGAWSLADGAAEFSDSIYQYVSGVSQVSEGADGLRDGLSAISEQTGTMGEGAAAAGERITELRAALAGMDIPEMDSTAAALESIIASVDTLQAELTALDVYPATVESAADTADELLAAVDLDVSSGLAGLDLTEEQRQAVLDAVDMELLGARENIAAARSSLSQMSDIGVEMTDSIDTAAISAAAAGLRAMAEQALEKIDELPASPNEALDSLEELIAGVTALCDGIDQLSEGSSTLADGAAVLSEGGAALQDASSALSSGASALAEGADALAEGLQEFDEEGISELTNMADDGLAELITRIRALREADIAYDNFGGIAEGRTGNVRFIIETDSIE